MSEVSHLNVLFLAALLCSLLAPSHGRAATAPGQPPTALVYGPAYLDHKTSPGHPERPERLESIMLKLGESHLLEQLLLIPPVEIEARWLTTVHTPQYVQHVKNACQQPVSRLDAFDTSISRESYQTALHAAGGVLAAVDAVMAGKAANAFCAVRPPGHHATKDRAMGFCIFNNVAIAARFIQKKHNLPKVLIVDWDVHHGNGTQAIFDDDPTVFYFSIHRSPFYPGSGAASERGVGKGEGTTLNVPLPPSTSEEEYIATFREKLLPAARDFKPDFVLVSAGFDAHKDDSMGGMKLSTEAYATMTQIVKQIAKDNCNGRLVSVLEGGYNVRSLATSVEAHVRVLMEREVTQSEKDQKGG